MHLAKKIGHIIGLPFLSVFLSITFQHSLEEKSYKTPPIEGGGVPRFEYRAPLLVPHDGVKSLTIDALRTTGERREVERRFGACDDRAIPTQCAGGECRECHRSAQDLTGRRYVLANMSDREIAHALLNFFLLALHRINPVPVGGPEDFNHLVEGAI